MQSIQRACLALFAAATLQAQDVSFEVASVKQAVMPTSNEAKRGLISATPGQITYTFVALGVLIEKAYDLKSFQVTGPDWIKTERYDIVAKLPTGTTGAQIPMMLQKLLAERFKIEWHRETKSLPVYELIAARNGFKGKSSEQTPNLRLAFAGKGRKLAGPGSMSALATTLSGVLDRPVVDATGIEGVYEIALDWTPDEREEGSLIAMKAKMAGQEAKTDSAGGPSLFTVLQESLGLKLEPKKSPVEMLVIDKAERVPTQN